MLKFNYNTNNGKIEAISVILTIKIYLQQNLTVLYILSHTIKKQEVNLVHPAGIE